MIVAIHQPNFVPWLGYFYKILRADVFVLLDDVQYTKNGFINRNRIKTPQGELWLTIPAAPKLDTLIKDVTVSDKNWTIKSLKTIKANYARAKHFGEVFDLVQKAIEPSPADLCGTNIRLIRALIDVLDLPCRIVEASTCPSDRKSDERLVDLVKAFGGDTYLSGYGGRNYQSEATFEQAGIACRYYDFKPSVYPQLWGDFIPGLSILDCLFNCGFAGTRDRLHGSGGQLHSASENS
jgi:hypothetical protein